MRKFTFLFVAVLLTLTMFAQNQIKQVPFQKGEIVNQTFQKVSTKSITGVINYDNSEIAFGLGNAEAHNIEPYHKFPADKIPQYVGESITHMKIGIADASHYTVIKLRIKEGNIDSDPVVDQEIAVANLKDGLNLLKLTSAYVIPASTDIFIGVYLESTGGFGIAMDTDGTNEPENSSLLFFSGTYYGSIAADYGDFIIQGIITDDGVADKLIDLKISDAKAKTNDCALSATESIMVTLKNAGEETISDPFNVTVKVNSETIIKQVVPTAFNAGTELVVEVLSFDMSTFGVNEVHVSHDFDDHISHNDMWEGKILSGDAIITIDITTDKWAGETSWAVFNSDGDAIATNGAMDGETNYVTDVCVGNSGCYTWAIFDSYGDGMGGDPGNGVPAGSFTVKYNGVDIGVSPEGGNFGTEFYIYGIATGCPDNEIELVEFDLPFGIEIGEFAIGGTLINMGTDNLTSFDVVYNVNQVTSSVYTHTGVNIAIGQTYEFEHETSFDFATAGNYQVSLTVLNPNGEVDADDSNNTKTDNMIVASSIVAKKQLFEHFTASTCPPCASYTPTADALLAANKDKYSLIRYQVNWPGNGDAYYIDQAGDRVKYYSVSGVPSVFRNGAYDMDVTQDVFDSYAEHISLIDLSVTASYEGNVVTVNADIKSLANLDAGLTAHIVVVENMTTGNVGSNGETSFHNVMMQMLPSSKGTVLEAMATDAEMSISETYNMSTTFVEEMSDLSAIVFIQDDMTKEMLQSEMVVVEIVEGVKDSRTESVGVYPNPFNNIFTIDNLDNSSKVIISNILGQKVIVINVTGNTMDINTSEFNRGVYLITVIDNDNSFRTVRVVKQ